MKTLKLVICAVALTAALVNSKAALIMSATGNAEVQKFFDGGAKTATTATLSFNNKFVYRVVSNAVANVATWAVANIPPVTLPADGYIAFNPTLRDGMVQGIFYVTNKSGFYHPLSGFDSTGAYYSWMELDSENEQYGYGAGGYFQFGWIDQNVPFTYFSGLASYHLNSQGIGTQTETSTAVLYIHDNPYSYNDPGNPDTFFNNLTAIEIHGILTATLATDDNWTTMTSISIKGSGNLHYRTTPIYYYTGYNLVKTATVKFVK